MSYAALPPTPAPSTDIKGQEATGLSQVDSTFQLPPSAVTHPDGLHSSPGQPDEPPSPANSDNVDRHHASDSSGFHLPPPPGRSRKMIQMKPKPVETEDDAPYVPGPKETKAKGKGAGRGKAGAQTNAAGRKVARKTAHSIIERRRRSKMNEEFGVLKDLIPACSGVDMHKLAILQASIDYLRYLETCVTDLKAGRAQSADVPSARTSNYDDESPSHNDQDSEAMGASDHDDPKEPDAMQVDDPSTETNYSPRSISSPLAATTVTALSPQTFPMLASEQQRHRSSASSASTHASNTTLPSPYFGPVHTGSSATSINTTFSRPASRAHSTTTTSPSFGPHYHNSFSSSSGFNMPPATLPGPFHRYSTSSSERNGSVSTNQLHFRVPSYSQSRASSTTTSPVIVPKDQGLNEAEASTALLMLNKDRRYSLTTDCAGVGAGATEVGSSKGQVQEPRRGMSVRDLLGG